ncbi:MAG: hypothetical protein AB1805_03910 [Nitrospirota bacterium]
MPGFLRAVRVLFLLIITLLSLFWGALLACSVTLGERRSLAPHLWHLLSIRTISVRGHCSPPLSGAAPDRKTLTSLAHQHVVSGLSSLQREVT